MEKIDTPRLTLRPPRPEDAPAMLAIRNSPYVRRYNPMRPWDLPRMQRQIEEEAAAGTTLYIEEKATGTLLGGIWLEPDELRYGLKAYTLSYYLAEPAAGRGLMTEALTAFIPQAFAQLQPALLSARVFTENQSSIRLLLKLGFTHEGTLRRAVTASGITYDDMLFSLLAEDLEALLQKEK